MEADFLQLSSSLKSNIVNADYLALSKDSETLLVPRSSDIMTFFPRIFSLPKEPDIVDIAEECEACSCLESDEDYAGCHECWERLEKNPFSQEIRQRASREKLLLEMRLGWNTFTFRNFLSIE
eukprot:CAMPEP_0196573234 /NCGR_PEP_ID=MMETSP1081-20130531/3162_1 /TAXON_ID=36882 /ORGANISM="Pyramimonas amylifera, Strain CCMP720" /LENGTH=122 /DNA_ID=CAMNT_0041890867 /DNA_START=505 /DNA_END=873 /DNA_ORIENTATION=-